MKLSPNFKIYDFINRLLTDAKFFSYYFLTVAAFCVLVSDLISDFFGNFFTPLNYSLAFFFHCKQLLRSFCFSPMIIAQNIPYCRFTDVIFFCKSSMGIIAKFIFFSNFFYALLTQFNKNFLSVFFNHVVSIVFISPEKKVRWVYASANVASMTNEHIVRDVSFYGFINKTMRRFCFAVNCYFSIPAAIYGPLPNKTSVNGYGVFQNKIFNRTYLRHIIVIAKFLDIINLKTGVSLGNSKRSASQ